MFISIVATTELEVLIFKVLERHKGLPNFSEEGWSKESVTYFFAINTPSCFWEDASNL